MGLFDSGIVGELTGANDAKDAIRKGMKRQREAVQRGIKEVRETSGRAMGLTREGFADARDLFGAGYADAMRTTEEGFGQGFDYLRQATSRLDPLAAMFDPSMANQFSIEGLAKNLGQFTDRSGPFGALIAERQRNALNQMSDVGIARSGTRAGGAADIDLETALSLNSMLFGQQMANPALQAMIQQSGYDVAGSQLAAQQGGALGALQVGRGTGLSGLTTAEAENLASMELGLGTNIANLESGLGAAEASAGQALAGTSLGASKMVFDAVGEAAGQALGGWMKKGFGSITGGAA
jgi:hypothetical protein